MQTWAPEDKQRIETELFRIADNLLPHISATAIHIALEDKHASTDLFNGSAGIILFYLRLYEYRHDPVHLQAAQTAADTLLQHPVVLQQEYYTLYTGATGLLYLCIKMYEATEEKKYISRALELSGHFEQGILEAVLQDDFISGHAGNIFVLTCLHAHTGDDRLRRLIRQLTDKMIQHARIAPQGLRWGHLKSSFDCLTGFSHGASGIAYGLMQVARYFGDEGLHYLAVQALQYEMLYYDEDTNNWLDLRLTSTRLYEEDIMDWQVTDFRKYASDANSWAHGAAGVGLARLYAWQVTQQDTYAQQAGLVIQRCLKDVRQLKRGDFTLCSGYGGLVAFFLQAAAMLHQPVLRLAARQLALDAVHYYHQHGTYNVYIAHSNNDPGLFSGLAGVGYMFLDVLLPYREDTLTHPMISPANGHAVTPLYAPGEVKQLLFSRYYSTTVGLLQQEGCNTNSLLSAAADAPALETQLQACITALPGPERLSITAHFELEQNVATMWRLHKGWLCYTKRKELLLAEAAPLLQATDELLLQTVFLPVNNVRLCYTPWDGAYQIIYSHEYGISAFQAGTFTAIIWNAMGTGKTLEQLMGEIGDQHFGQAGAEQRQQVAQAVIAQVRAMLQQCFIKKQGDT